jgi:large subunit ribosomal protein L1
VSGKRYREAAKLVDREREYLPADAVRLIKRFPDAKFDETVELAFRLGVDPRKADQMVRGTVTLPHGTGRSVRVAAFATGPKATEAKEAGADLVGGEELVEEVLKGNIDFDATVATPDMMATVGKAGRVLGPRGLMPNPKTGTVTPDVTNAVKETKAGKVEYRVDKTGVIHVPVGKVSFSSDKITANAKALIDAVIKAKPATAKGKYVKKVNVATTMGPGILVDPTSVGA